MCATRHPEACEQTVPVREFEADVISHVPVYHGRYSPKLAAIDSVAIEVGIRHPRDKLPGAGPTRRFTREDRMQRRDAIEVGAFAVVRTRLSGHYVGNDDFASVEEWVGGVIGIRLLEEVLKPYDEWTVAVVDFGRDQI